MSESTCCSRIYGTLRPEFGSKSEELRQLKEFAPLCKVHLQRPGCYREASTLLSMIKSSHQALHTPGTPRTSNPAGSNLPSGRRKVLENAEDDVAQGHMSGGWMTVLA